MKTPFPITNNSPHFFTADDVAKLREYVTTRTTDEIKSAEITRTTIICTTNHGVWVWELEFIFPCINTQAS